MTVTGQASAAARPRRCARIPDRPIDAGRTAHFDIDDDDYAEIVRRVVKDEIGEGEGANFVIKRSFVADITDYTPRSALAFFRRLLERESGAYWTFLVHTGERTLRRRHPRAARQPARRHRRDEPDQRHLPLPAGRPDAAGA